MDTLFSKALRLSLAARDSHGIGAVATLMSNDAAKLWNLPQYLHMLWSGPFQILIIMLLLVRVLTLVPALVGLAVCVAIIPLSTTVGKHLGTLRKVSMAATQERVRLCSEVVMGIKAIKLYAWEAPYVQRIEAARARELAAVRKSGVVAIFNGMIFQGAPVLISIGALVTYAALGHAITADVVFPALSLFNLLRFPVMMFPNQITNIINGRVRYGFCVVRQSVHLLEKCGRRAPGPQPMPPTPITNPFQIILQVALRRLQSFMEAEEVDAVPPELAVGPPTPAVVVRDGTFAWSRSAPPLLTVPSLALRAGSLTVVIGDVAAGKSSLLAALLGEMHALRGSVCVHGSVAYTAQDPWIRNASLRENVTMGEVPRQEWYDAVLDACALRPDLAALPAGDATEIGEKGVNLSGGQRHRVALARACYAAADVYLLDDPLSAVDAHVGRHLWEECLTGLLSGRTRVLVTHQVQYAAAADCVVVVRGGTIADVGPPYELAARGVDMAAFALPGRREEVGEGEDTATLAGGAGDGLGGAAAANGASMGDLLGADSDGDAPPTATSRATPPPSVFRTGEQAGGGPAGAAVNSEFVGVGLDEAPASPGASPAAAPVSPVPSTPAPSATTQPDRDLSSARRTVSFAAEPAADRQTPSSSHPKSALAAKPSRPTSSGVLVKAEERAVGRVERAVYRVYLAAWGRVGPGGVLPVPAAIVACAALERGLQVGQNLFLAVWSNMTAGAGAGPVPPASQFAAVYASLGVSSLAVQASGVWGLARRLRTV